MLTYVRFITFLMKDDRGASMVEYSLLVIMIAIAALLAVTVGGNELSETYSEISSSLVDAGS